MLSQPIGSLEGTAKVVSVPLQTSVADAAALMSTNRVSAVLVVEGGEIVGICTERDIVYRVIAPGREPSRVPVGEVMTHDPLTADPDTLLGRALVVMHDRGVRHLPIVREGKAVGMVCARDALDPELEEFICEEIRRRSYR
jgi:CBS domain-containing protein